MGTKMNVEGLDGLLVGHECRPITPFDYDFAGSWGKTGYPLQRLPLYRTHSHGIMLTRGVPGAFALTPVTLKGSEKWKMAAHFSRQNSKFVDDVIGVTSFEIVVGAAVPPLLCLVRCLEKRMLWHCPPNRARRCTTTKQRKL